MRKVKGLDCILLVDDDAITNLIHKRIIESAGLDVHIQVAQNGREAIDYLRNTNADNYIKPGIIFLDINMPEMNGWDFLEHYNTLPEADKVKAVVVLLTTSLDPRERESAEKNPGVQKFLNKTLNLEKLEDIIETHFN